MSAAAPRSLFNPREARAQGIPFKVLSPDEVTTVEALSDALVPGAREAGVSHYIDHELASPSPRLLLRFAQLRGPRAPYYHGALAAFAASMTAQEHGAFASLSPDAQHTVIEALRTGTIKPRDARGVSDGTGAGRFLVAHARAPAHRHAGDRVRAHKAVGRGRRRRAGLLRDD